VVASDVGNLRNIIRQGETGFVVPENTPPRLAGAIALFLDGAPRDMESTRIMRASVSRYAWKNIAVDITAELRRAQYEVAGVK
jgi:glycosyltransferase involved in cell wall biosynthesis